MTDTEQSMTPAGAQRLMVAFLNQVRQDCVAIRSRGLWDSIRVSQRLPLALTRRERRHLISLVYSPTMDALCRLVVGRPAAHIRDVLHLPEVIPPAFSDNPKAKEPAMDAQRSAAVTAALALTIRSDAVTAKLRAARIRLAAVDPAKPGIPRVSELLARLSTMVKDAETLAAATLTAIEDIK